MALKFSDNTPLTLTFPFGDFKEIEGIYGPQYLYTVEHDGERDRLYAAPALHHELQLAGVAPGATYTIVKEASGDLRKYWRVTLFDPGSDGENEGNGRPDPASAAPARPPLPARPGFAALRTLLADCLQTSWLAWQGLEEGACTFTSEDVRGIAITLFLECARKGVLTDYVEADLPF